MMKAQRAAFTLLEVLVVIGTLFLLVVVVLVVQNTTSCKGRSSRISCASNLRQIGLAFRMWANDHNEKFPMALTIAEGGTKELALQGLPLASFTIISNELNNPKPLSCPDDDKRTRATNFTRLRPKNLSYFLGLDASEMNPASILAGDRNMCINGQPTNGFVEITNWAAVTWSARIHNRQGNIGLADGSAHQVTDNQIQKQLQASGATTNRFAIP
jgi:competence protein ComGC